jgi:hypothetical protein
MIHLDSSKSDAVKYLISEVDRLNAEVQALRSRVPPTATPASHPQSFLDEVVKMKDVCLHVTAAESFFGKAHELRQALFGLKLTALKVRRVLKGPSPS